MSTSLARATTTATDVFVSTKFGSAGTDFWIKVQDSIIRFHNPKIETTGDDDSSPQFEGAYYQYCSFTFKGFAVAAAGSVGSGGTLASFTDSAKNPLASTTLKIHLANAKVLTMTTPYIEDMVIGHSRMGSRGAIVALSMAGVNTGTAATLDTT